MKRLLVCLTLIVAGSSALVIAKVSNNSTEERFIILRVTSSNLKEEMKFDASYIFRAGNSQLQTVERQTPFEVKVKSDYVAGIFRRTSGGGDLLVTVTTSTDGKTEQGHVAASGDIVVISTTPEAAVATKPEARYSFTGQAFSVK